MSGIEILGLVFAGLVVGPLAMFVRRRSLQATRRKAERGEDVRLGAFLRGSAKPYPGRWKQGSLRTGERPLRWEYWDRVRVPIPLVGLTLVHRERVVIPNAPDAAVSLRLRDPAGRVVELATDERYADLLLAALHAPAGSAPAAARRRVPVLALVCLGLCALWLGVWAYVWLAGDHVTGRVTSNDEGSCGVTWTTGGEAHTAVIDCAAQRPGDPIDLVAPPAPFAGDAVDVQYTPWVVATVAALLAVVPAGAGLARRLLARRAARRGGVAAVPDAVPGLAPTLAAVAAPPELGRHELRWSSVAPYLAERARAEGWYDAAPPPWWQRWWRRGHAPRTHILRRALTFAVWPAFGALLATMFLWSAVDSSRVDPARARVADGVVTAFSGGVPYVPSEVTVEYDPGGGREEARASSLRSFDEGEPIRVLYDPAHPGRVRLPGDADGAPRGVALLRATLAAAGALLLLVLATALARLARVRRLRRTAPRHVRYAIVRGGVGEFGMLVFDTDGDPRPEAVVPLDDLLPDWLPVTGEADVRGPLDDGARPVVTVAGHEVFPPEDVVVPTDTDVLASFVSGEIPVDPDDEPQGLRTRDV